MKNAFVSFSGGKDCNLAMYRGMRRGYQVRALLNMLSGDGERCAWHGVSADVIKAQAAAMNVQIIQEKTTLDEYESNFRKICAGLKEDGVSHGIFGDIDIAEHRDWVERVCGDSGIVPVFPLWMADQSELAAELTTGGFRALVVSAKSGLGLDMCPGAYLDTDMIDMIIAAGATPCGEQGEYHTIITDAPHFARRLKILSGNRYSRDGYIFYSIEGFALEEK